MKSAPLETQKKARLAVSFLETVVIRDWGCRWQSLDSQNDDGIDGLIFIERGGVMNGQIIYVQVKSSSKNHNGSYYTVSKAKKKLHRNINRWKRLVSCVILVYCDLNSEELFWINLNDSAIFTDTQIKISINNKFNLYSKKTILSLCGSINSDLRLPKVATISDDFYYLVNTKNVKSNARKIYSDLNKAKFYFKQSRSGISFTREGWHHINRPTRSPLTRLHSLCLLGAIRAIIQSSSEQDLVTVRKCKNKNPELVAIKVVVIFSFRQPAVVTVVFKKRFDIANLPNYSFHTIYEPRRRRDLLGLSGYDAAVHE